MGRNDGVVRGPAAKGHARPRGIAAIILESAVYGQRTRHLSCTAFPRSVGPRSRALCGRSTSGISGSLPAGISNGRLLSLQSCRGKKSGKVRYEGSNEQLKPVGSRGDFKAHVVPKAGETEPDQVVWKHVALEPLRCSGKATIPLA